MNEQLYAALEEAGVDTKECIARCCDNEALFIRLLKVMFQGNEEAEHLRKACQAKDYKQLFDIAHGMKGATGSIGLLELHEMLDQLVSCIRAEQYDDLERITSEFLDKYYAMKALIEENLDGTVSKP